MNKKYIIDNEELINEWHWEKNKVLYLDPKTLTYGVTKKAWWKCDKGHEWQAELLFLLLQVERTVLTLCML